MKNQLSSDPVHTLSLCTCAWHSGRNIPLPLWGWHPTNTASPIGRGKGKWSLIFFIKIKSRTSLFKKAALTTLSCKENKKQICNVSIQINTGKYKLIYNMYLCHRHHLAIDAKRNKYIEKWLDIVAQIKNISLGDRVPMSIASTWSECAEYHKVL